MSAASIRVNCLCYCRTDLPYFLAYDVQLEETASKISVKRGENFLLKCKVRSKNGSTKYRWKLNGQEVKISPRRILIDDNGNLLTKRADETRDEGEYVCEVEDSLTGEKISSSASLVRVYCKYDATLFKKKKKNRKRDRFL